MTFDTLATQKDIDTTIAALKANGIEAVAVATGADAKTKLMEMIPAGASVMNMTSVTLDAISASTEVNESGKYEPIRVKLMDQATSADRKRELGAAPEWTIGSVHALTQDGKLIIASNSGSQLPAYAYGAEHVIFVISAQKIVKNLDEGMKRLYEHVLPLESERANKAYNITSGSFISKLLIINREIQPGRITVIIVNEKLGF